MKKNISAFLLLCGQVWGTMQWSSPVTLSIPEQDATETVFNLNCPSNQAVAAWKSSNGTHTVIQAALFNGTSWSSVTTLSNTSFDADQPRLAINDAGHAVVVWRKTVDTTTSVVEGAFFNGTTWSSPAAISSESESTVVDGGSVAIDCETDEAIAVWRVGKGIGNLQTAKFDGESWTLISDFNPLASPSKSSVVVNGYGEAITAWVYTDNTDAIKTAIYTDSWSSPVEIGSSVLQLGLSHDTTGHQFMLLWSTLKTIQSSLWDGASWSSPHTLLGPVSFVVDPYTISHPSRSAFAAVWRGSSGVQGAIYEGGAWSGNLTFSEIGFTPRACFNPIDGTVAVVWALTDRIQFCEYTSSEFSTPVDISGTSPNQVVGSPRIGIDSEGRALALWYLSDGTHTLVQAAHGTTE